MQGQLGFEVTEQVLWCNQCRQETLFELKEEGYWLCRVCGWAMPLTLPPTLKED